MQNAQKLEFSFIVFCLKHVLRCIYNIFYLIVQSFLWTFKLLQLKVRSQDSWEKDSPAARLK